ncbi:unnamed protein product [Prorocentrum cordatum]|uniref:Uncharacterized protein n=1 Tax=Prorocentrum cordatum TaxID=2364126 RepID=A0ABN9SE58_9DINO|nr:unnamed protein product [Polarella glacialis]
MKHSPRCLASMPIWHVSEYSPYLYCNGGWKLFFPNEGSDTVSTLDPAKSDFISARSASTPSNGEYRTVTGYLNTSKNRSWNTGKCRRKLTMFLFLLSWNHFSSQPCGHIKGKE